MFRKTFAMIFGLALAQSSVAAPVKSAACNSCSYAQLETTAIGQGVGVRYLHDLAGGKFYKYEVNKEPAPNGRWIYEALEVGAEAAYVQAFLDLKSFYDANGKKWEIFVSRRLDVPKPGQAAAGTAARSAGGNISAWDAVDAGLMQNAVIDELGNNWAGFVGGLSTTFYTGLSAMRVIDINAIPGVTFEVIFTDGSKMTFKFDAQTMKYKYVKGTARDAVGNNIPETKADIVRGGDGATQRYYYEGSDGAGSRERAMERFQQLGIPMTTGRVWACVAAGPTITCMVVR